MKRIIHSAKSSILVALAALIFISPLPVHGQNTQSATADRQLNLLVLGDSIPWGQGLREENKAWYLVKTWLEANHGRPVSEKVLAHSGAVIGTAGEPGGNLGPVLDGEVNRGVPSINDQIESALRLYADPATVDLVIVDGCINDLDARRLLNADNTPQAIREVARQKCGPPVEAMLTRIAGSFPNAHVIVTGYYPILSEGTARDIFMRAMMKRLYTGTAPMNDKQLRARLIEISREWYEGSNQMLAGAAAKVDAELAAKGSRQRALFAEVSFLPEHSFAASQSRLWGFDASWIRKVLVILTLGRVTLKTNDEQRNQRGTSCKNTFKAPAGERKQPKKAREALIMLCRLAAIGHPNRRGAQMYADAINNQLKLVLSSTGWLRSLGAVAVGNTHR
jgi:lysophospholipase L1-like esterase